MKNHENIGSLDNLHEDFLSLLEKKKLHPQSAAILSTLDIDAEQLWVLRFYKEHGAIPTIKQMQAIKAAFDKKKLTVKACRGILSASLQPKKIVLDYTDVAQFFDDDSSIEEIKQGILKVLSNWTNNRTQSANQ